jgi:hypothetical protein
MRKVDIVLIFLLVLILIFLLIDIIRITGEGGRCLRNTVSFMLDKMSASYGGEIYCSCSKGIFINRTGIYKGGFGYDGWMG